jgi:hypothetical protein
MKWQLNDSDDAGSSDAGMQDARQMRPDQDQPNRTLSLKLKVRLRDGGGAIPQVDGVADDEDDTADEAHVAAKDLCFGQLNQQGTSTAADRGETHTTEIVEDIRLPHVVKESRLIAAVKADDIEAAGDHEAGPVAELASREAPERIPGEASPASLPVQLEHGHQTDAVEDHASAANQRQHLPVHAPTASEAKAGKAVKFVEGPTASEHPGPTSEEAPDLAAEVKQAHASHDAGVLKTEAPVPGLQGTAAVASESHLRDSGARPQLENERGPKPFSEQEGKALAALVHALRRWLREMGGVASVPSEMDDPEVCRHA